MTKPDHSFQPDHNLQQAIDLLQQAPANTEALPEALPDSGLGESATLMLMGAQMLNQSAYLDAPNALAHMDPPTPSITWAMHLWNARLNQNLLHPATAPFAREAEQKVIDWLAPLFGMQGGHMCSGSTIANLTAIWAARDTAGVKKIVTSEAAHISIDKAAKLLGLLSIRIPTNSYGEIDVDQIDDLTDTCLVLTAGTTAAGRIDPLNLAGQAAWTHVDAAWAGPLRLSTKHRDLLEGIEQADSVAVSAHKWLFQPKDSALIFFKDLERANAAISFGGGYLAAPNVGIQGSRGAAAIPLLATLIAWGKAGYAERIDHTMWMAEKLAATLEQQQNIQLWANPQTGINVFRPTSMSVDALAAKLPEGMFSTCTLNGETWLRSVAANPMADIDLIIAVIRKVMP